MTRLAKRTDPRWQTVAGEHMRYVTGHARRRAVQYIVEDRGYDTPCWIWQGSLIDGYGKLNVRGRMMRAHRYMYEKIVGPIPEGLDLDHLCRVRSCCNPEHMQPVTRSVNIKRAHDAKVKRKQA